MSYCGDGMAEGSILGSEILLTLSFTSRAWLENGDNVISLQPVSEILKEPDYTSLTHQTSPSLLTSAF